MDSSVVRQTHASEHGSRAIPRRLLADAPTPQAPTACRFFLAPRRVEAGTRNYATTLPFANLDLGRTSDPTSMPGKFDQSTSLRQTASSGSVRVRRSEHPQNTTAAHRSALSV